MGTTLGESANNVFLKRTVDIVVMLLVLVLFCVGIVLDVFHNPLKRSKEFRRVRTVNWLLMGWARAVKTMIRYSFYSLSTEVGSSYLNLSNVEYTVVSTLGLWVMPNGLLLNGWLVDRFRERAIMLFSLLSNFFTNLIFALVLLIANGTILSKICCFIYFPLICYYLSFSEVVINKNNAEWYESEERGVIAGIFTLCIAIGYCLGFAGNSLIIEVTGAPSMLFFVNAALLASCALLSHAFLVEDVPKSLTYRLLQDEEEKEAARAASSPNGLQPIDSPSPRESISSIQEAVQTQQVQSAQQSSEVPQAPRPQKKDPPLKSVILSVDFIAMCICFSFVGVLRDSFWVWINQYIQVRFKLQIGSPEQMIAFASLTVGAALSAFVSAFMSLIFKTKYAWNGAVCFLGAVVTYICLTFAQNVWFAIGALGLATIFSMAILSIRRILSMSLGGKSTSGVITGILASSTFFGGGVGAFIFKWFIQLDPSYSVMLFALAVVSLLGMIIFMGIGLKNTLIEFWNSKHEKQYIPATVTSSAVAEGYAPLSGENTSSNKSVL